MSGKSITNALSELCGKRDAAIFGAGTSARAAARLLAKYGIKSRFYQQVETNHADLSANASAEFGEKEAREHKLVVYSPAFRPDHPWIETARANGCTAICEPDLCAECFGGKIIAVTGTDGKTTVTSFLTHALKSAGYDAFAAGNIGRPLSNFCADFAESGENTSQKIAVCELSSFQTFGMSRLNLDALLWTNFAPDHMDWHKDMREYFSAKLDAASRLRPFGGKGKIFICGSSVSEASRAYGAPLPDFAKILDFESMRKNSEMNFPEPFTSFAQAQNFALVKSFWERIGLDCGDLARAAETFSLPAYRFGAKTTVDGVDFYNDSKATNVHSAVAAIRELAGAETLVWIGGGKDKFCPLDELVGALLECADAAVLIGQTADKLSKQLSKLPLGAHKCKTLESAVKKAYALAKGKKAAAVLFSPAFSSFGMFSGYVERGKSFENALLCLKNRKYCK